MIFLIDEFEPQEKTHGIKIIESKIDVLGKPLYFRIGVKDGLAGLSDIVPLAHTISDKLCAEVIKQFSDSEKPVPCRKGCSSCCDYLVPLSLPEVYYMQTEIAALDNNTQIPLLCSCVSAARKILNSENLHKHNIVDGGDTLQISQWHEELELSCPFLKDNICSIYDKRPLACREHMVTGTSQSCQKDQTDSPDILKIPVSMLEVLGKLAAELEQTDIEAVLLPLALVCMDSYSERSVRTWPAENIAGRFVGIMEAVLKESADLLISIQ